MSETTVLIVGPWTKFFAALEEMARAAGLVVKRIVDQFADLFVGPLDLELDLEPRSDLDRDLARPRWPVFCSRHGEARNEAGAVWMRAGGARLRARARDRRAVA